MDLIPFPEPVFEFPPQHKSEFTNENPLRQYDNRREPWPKCRHGEDMGNTRFFHFFIFNETPYMKFILQSSDTSENCGFTRWVDPAPIDVKVEPL